MYGWSLSAIEGNPPIDRISGATRFPGPEADTPVPKGTTK